MGHFTNVTVNVGNETRLDSRRETRFLGESNDSIALPCCASLPRAVFEDRLWRTLINFSREEENPGVEFLRGIRPCDIAAWRIWPREQSSITRLKYP